MNRLLMFAVLIAGCPHRPGYSRVEIDCGGALAAELPANILLDPSFVAAAAHIASTGDPSLATAQIEVGHAGGIDGVVWATVLDAAPGVCPSLRGVAPELVVNAGYQPLFGLAESGGRWGFVYGLTSGTVVYSRSSASLVPFVPVEKVELLQMDGGAVSVTTVPLAADGAIPLPDAPRPGWAELVASDGTREWTLALLPPDVEVPAPASGADLLASIQALRPVGPVKEAALGPCGAPVDYVDGIAYQRTQRCAGVPASGASVLHSITMRPLVARVLADPGYDLVTFEVDTNRSLVWVYGLKRVTPSDTPALQAAVDAELAARYPGATHVPAPGLADLLDTWIAAGATEDADTAALTTFAQRWSTGGTWGYMRARDQNITGLLARKPPVGDVVAWSAVAAVARGPEGDLRQHVMVVLAGR